jgi:uncharacterized protein (DUF2267 family)
MMRNETHLDFFDNAVRDAYGWLDDIVAGAAWDDRSVALRALGATLQALRDELTTEQNTILSAQLPTIIRGIYYEGWKPHENNAPKGTRERFLNKITVALSHPYNEFDPEEIAETVLEVLTVRAPRETAKIRTTLPAEIQRLFPPS